MENIKMKYFYFLARTYWKIDVILRNISLECRLRANKYCRKAEKIHDKRGLQTTNVE